MFSGSGATAGINRIIDLLAIRDRVARGDTVKIFLGPYEHHSNLLPWRECGAEVIEIPEANAGGPDPKLLERALTDARDADLIVGSFSAASNVTGICAPVDQITTILKRHGAISVWDYAGGAPYMPFDMGQGAAAKDAIVYSSHKFPGGPGASGVLILRDTIVRRDTPTTSGGGTVSFVSPWSHHYSANVIAREEAGTPNVIGDIRAALVMLVKEAIGQSYISHKNNALRQKALAVWRRNPRIELLGNLEANETLPIFAFRVRRADGGLFHHQLFTRMLSDRYGIQARGGCACAGSYAHSLLGIDQAQSDDIVARLNRGEEMCKPGWVRLNFSYLLSDDKADFIVNAVDELASSCDKYEEWVSRRSDNSAVPASLGRGSGRGVGRVAHYPSTDHSNPLRMTATDERSTTRYAKPRRP